MNSSEVNRKIPITDWFLLRQGDMVEIGNQVGVVRNIGNEFTNIELGDGEYLIPHAKLDEVMDHIKFKIV